MSEHKKRSLEERLQDNPTLRKRLESILDIAENAHGEFKTADEAEERAIEELRRLGNELLQEWAVNQEKKVVEDLGRQTDHPVGHGKKNSTGKRHTAK
jgi:vacuolar-type H+-ATPase subunit B/Vma2